MKKENKEQNAEPIAAKLITLESNIGKCAFSISCLGIKPETKMAELFLGYHLWHKVQSLMFAGGKKAKFTKESPFSPELEAHAKAIALAELGLYFEDVSITTAEEVKQSDEQKFVKFSMSLGMSEEIARAGWATAQAAKAAADAAAKPAEKVLE